MPTERDSGYRKPSETILFHLNDEELKEKFPEWYERNHSAGNEFNSQYSTNAPELKMVYNHKAVRESFGPLIDTVEQQIKTLQNTQVLEVGGASGLLAKYLQDNGAKVTLLETQENFVKKAQERGVDARVYNGTNITRSISSGEKFGAVIASRVFEDIVMSENQALILMRQIKPLLKPDGALIIGTQRKEAVWHSAIVRGSGLNLAESNEFPENNYIRQVLVYR